MQRKGRNAIWVLMLVALCIGVLAVYVYTGQPAPRVEVPASKYQPAELTIAPASPAVAVQRHAVTDPQVQEQVSIAASEAAYRIVTPLMKVISDYHANEVAADNAYRGRWIHFRAVAGNVEKDIGDVPFLFVHTTDPASVDRVSVRFAAVSMTDVAKVQPGQIIDLYCKGNGMSLRTPGFTSCSFLSGGYVTAPYAAAQGAISAISTDDPRFEPSFDCATQKGTAAWLICHDADLAAADVRLDAAAHTVLKQARALDDLTQSTDAGGKFNQALHAALEKRNECTDVPCLAAWYFDAEKRLHDTADKLDTLVEQGTLAGSLSQ